MKRLFLIVVVCALVGVLPALAAQPSRGGGGGGGGGGMVWPVWSPDGTRLAFVSTLMLMDFVTLYDTSDFEAKPVYLCFFGDMSSDGPRAVDLAFSPDGKLIATADGKSQVTLWHADTLEISRGLRGGTPKLLAFSPDSTLLVSLQGTRLQLWDLTTDEKGPWISAPMTAGMLFMPDSQRLITYGCKEETDGICAAGQITFWNVDTGETLFSLEGQPDRIVGVGLMPDGQTLIAGSQDGSIWRWDIQAGTGEVLIEGDPEGAALAGLSLKMDGSQLALGFDDGTIRLVDTDSGAEIMTITQSGAVTRINFSPDGTKIASGAQPKGGSGSHPVHVWDAATGEILATLGGKF